MRGELPRTMDNPNHHDRAPERFQIVRDRKRIPLMGIRLAHGRGRAREGSAPKTLRAR